MNAVRAVIALVAAMLALTACGATQAATPSVSNTTHRARAHAPTDPYKTYLSIAPKGAPHLSREDAQTRAYLGCHTKWAPGTVDYALHQAYKDLCE